MELDRAGSDFVSYGLTNTSLDAELKKIWKEGQGSFSDICFMETDIARFNIGVGYQYAHSKDSLLDITDYTTQRKKIAGFIWQYSKKAYKTTGKPWGLWRYPSAYNPHDLYNDELCSICGIEYADELCYGTPICENCFNAAIDQMTYTTPPAVYDYDNNEEDY